MRDDRLGGFYVPLKKLGYGPVQWANMTLEQAKEIVEKGKRNETPNATAEENKKKVEPSKFGKKMTMGGSLPPKFEKVLKIDTSIPDIANYNKTRDIVRRLDKVRNKLHDPIKFKRNDFERIPQRQIEQTAKMTIEDLLKSEDPLTIEELKFAQEHYQPYGEKAKEQFVEKLQKSNEIFSKEDLAKLLAKEGEQPQELSIEEQANKIVERYNDKYEKNLRKAIAHLEDLDKNFEEKTKVYYDKHNEMKKTMQNYAKDLTTLNSNIDVVSRHLELQKRRIMQEINYINADIDHQTGVMTLWEHLGDDYSNVMQENMIKPSYYYDMARRIEELLQDPNTTNKDVLEKFMHKCDEKYNSAMEQIDGVVMNKYLDMKPYKPILTKINKQLKNLGSSIQIKNIDDMKKLKAVGKVFKKTADEILKGMEE